MRTKRPLVLALAFLLAAVLGPAALATEGGGASGGTVIPVIKVWEDESNAKGLRPDSITLDLYRYREGEAPDYTDPYMTIELSQDGQEDPDAWEGAFVVPGASDPADDQAFYYDADRGVWCSYRFEVAERPVSHYMESAHIDPEVVFEVSTDPGDWQWITPGSSLSFPLATEGDTVNFLAAKQTGNRLIIWTPDELSFSEREVIRAYVVSHPMFPQSQDSVGYVSGYGDFSDGGAGFSVVPEANGEPGAIVFEGHSAWSFWARGTYRRSSLDARTAYLENTLATVDVTVSKVWADADDKDGVRPQAVTVHVCAGDEDTGIALELSEDNGWMAVAHDLDEYADGETISYRVIEDVPEGYEASVTQEGNTFTVMNTHVPEEPADPVKPDDPVDPVKPDDPVDPVKPDDPTDPVKPDDPTKPEDPVKPSDPVKPADPAKPADPVKVPAQQPTRPPAVPSTGDSTVHEAAAALVLAVPAVLAAASALRRACAEKTRER